MLLQQVLDHKLCIFPSLLASTPHHGLASASPQSTESHIILAVQVKFYSCSDSAGVL